MSVQKLEERPPFVRFETRSIEDREATVAKGMYVGNDVDYALITPHGSKDVIEREVKDWLEQLRHQVAQERCNPEWAMAFQRMYEAFKEGKELPVSGTPVLNWPGLSPSQVKQLLSLNFRAVEDVAAMNEEAIARLGMGARALRDRARLFLETAQNVGSVAEKAAAIEVENAQLKASNDSLKAQVDLLSRQVAAIAAAQAGLSGGQSPQPTGDISAADLLDDEKPAAMTKL